MTEQYSPGQMGQYEFRNLDWDTATDVPVDPIVINTWYTALLPTRNVKAPYLVVVQTNNGATNETIVVEITINGTIYLYTADTVSAATWYYFFSANGNMARSPIARQLLSIDPDQSAPLETRILGIRVRQVTAVDVVSAIIEVNMVYATLERSR